MASLDEKAKSLFIGEKRGEEKRFAKEKGLDHEKRKMHQE